MMSAKDITSSRSAAPIFAFASAKASRPISLIPFCTKLRFHSATRNGGRSNAINRASNSASSALSRTAAITASGSTPRCKHRNRSNPRQKLR